MTWYRKNPLFAGALTLCALLVLGELGLVFERFRASRAAEAKLIQKTSELAAMKDVVPPPTRPVATAIESDLSRAERALAAMQAELKGRGPAAERMQKAKVPAARTDAYFDLATFVEKTRDLARKNEVEVRPEASRFGFSLYANEGPDTERIEAVFHQRQIAQYLIESLIEAHPRTLISVKREHPLTRKQREERAAAAAAASGLPPPEASTDAPLSIEEGPDFFVIDPRASVRAPGFLDSTAFHIVFIGQTSSLRAFLNRLASFELPVLVREVEVEPASTEDLTAVTVPDESAAPDQQTSVPSSVVLTANPSAKTPEKKPAPKASKATPIVSRPYSRFSVTVEYIELVPPTTNPTNPADPAAPAAPTT